jgi:hypothetical protein
MDDDLGHGPHGNNEPCGEFGAVLALRSQLPKRTSCRSEAAACAAGRRKISWPAAILWPGERRRLGSDGPPQRIKVFFMARIVPNPTPEIYHLGRDTALDHPVWLENHAR